MNRRAFLAAAFGAATARALPAQAHPTAMAVRVYEWNAEAVKAFVAENAMPFTVAELHRQALEWRISILMSQEPPRW